MASPTYEDIVQKDILELLNLQGVEDDKKQEVYQKLYSTVENRAMLRIDDLLTNEQVDEWKRILEENDRAKADQYMESLGIDVEKIILEETALLKGQIVFLLEGAQDPLVAAEA